MIICKAPLRISLGGGGTDLPSWYSKYGSYLITAAINKYIYVTISERKIFKDYWISYSRVENHAKLSNIEHTIIREILKNFEFSNGLEIHTISELPGNTGMGSSGSLSVAILHALAEYKKQRIIKDDLAEKASSIEMKINNYTSGKQDQYISTYGGLIELSISKAGKVFSKRINISNKIKKKLCNNLFLIYSKKQRHASQVLTKQSKSLKSDFNKKKLMHTIQNLAYETREILKKGNLDQLGEIFDLHWETKKKFGNYMTTNAIDDLYHKLKLHGSTGGKIIGAGGGGFILSYVPEINQPKFLNFLKKKKIQMIDWSFDNCGSQIVFNDKKT